MEHYFTFLFLIATLHFCGAALANSEESTTAVANSEESNMEFAKIVPALSSYTYHVCSVYCNQAYSTKEKKFIKPGHIGGSTLITMDIVITVAACVDPLALEHRRHFIPTDLEVRCGYNHKETDHTKTRKIGSVIYDPDYTPGDKNAHLYLAVVKVSCRFDSSSHLKPIHLEPNDLHHWECRALGWGQVQNNHTGYPARLRMLNMTVDPSYVNENEITLFPTAGKGALCAGDLGSPVICNNRLVCIVSECHGCSDKKKASAHDKCVSIAWSSGWLYSLDELSGIKP